MRISQFTQAAAMTAATLLVMAGSAGASTIIYNTNDTLGFGGTSLTLNNTSGPNAATLQFLAIADTTITVPSFVNYGYFNLTCPTCTGFSGSTFGAFTFDLIITDVNSGATGTFVGTSPGGSIFPIAVISRSAGRRCDCGGTSNATSGNFGSTYYTSEETTTIVAPNSGPRGPRDTRASGLCDERSEPASVTLFGGALLGLGLLRFKRSNRK